MKHILLILVLLVVASPAHAAYWVVDENVTSKSDFRLSLSESERQLLGSYKWHEVSDAIVSAKSIKECKSSYTRLVSQLREFEKKVKTNNYLKTENALQDRETILFSPEANIKRCVAKYSATPSADGQGDLSKRITTMEKQIQKIIKALQNAGIKVE